MNPPAFFDKPDKQLLIAVLETLVISDASVMLSYIPIQLLFTSSCNICFWIFCIILLSFLYFHWKPPQWEYFLSLLQQEIMPLTLRFNCLLASIADGNSSIYSPLLLYLSTGLLKTPFLNFSLILFLDVP